MGLDQGRLRPLTASLRSRAFQFEAPWQWLPPKGEIRSLLLGLHGMAQDSSRMVQKLDFLRQQGVGLILPSGPYPMEVRGRSGVRQGHAWYIFTGDQPEFKASMEKSENDLLGLIEIVQKEIDNPNIPWDLLGFSQGGYLAGFMALRHPELFRSCVIASARLKYEFLEQELESQPNVQMLFLHDKNDPLTKSEPVEESQKILERAGVISSIQWHDEGHTLGTESLNFLAQWLKELTKQ